ncbi:MAG: ABC transporter permease [Eubacteriales bacterium]|nr:ABC transporter permease [Eubacteriales bacterium]
MIHFWYRIKVMLRERSSIFWNLIFPIFLGFLFYVMFNNIINNVEKFSEISVGLVLEQEQADFSKLIKEVEVEGGKKMFAVTEYKDADAAKKALDEDEIYGYITVADDFHLVVKASNIQTTVIKVFLDQYIQNSKLIENVAKENPQQVNAVVQGLMNAGEIEIKNIPLPGQDKSPYTQYFYALIAMTCLIASTIGLQNGNNIQADLSALAARRNVAPTKKMKQVLIDFLASYLVVGIMATIILAMVVYGFKQDFGGNIAPILLVTWVGSFTGLAGGMMIGVCLKGSKRMKEGFSTAFFMGSSFLGGLQIVTITYVIEKHCPIINRINPATLIVNACKSLAVFGDTRQYVINLVTLTAIGIAFLIISILKLRRTKYASI